MYNIFLSLNKLKWTPAQQMFITRTDQ